MIIKERELPVAIEKLKALLRRLPPTHQRIPDIKEALRKRLAGFKGENSLDYPLNFLPEKRYFILHDLRLRFRKIYFQIDTLILSNHFILIIEVKNIAGTLYFDDTFNQLIRKFEGKEDSFPDPLTQVTRQEHQLKEWLRTNNLPDLPITSLIVISRPQTIIRTIPENNIKVANKVIHLDVLPSKISQLEHLYPKKPYNEQDLNLLIQTLLKKHTPIDSSILQQFQLQKSTLLKGVQCPRCSYLPLIRVHSNWACPSCILKFKTAHEMALKDFSLLINPTITSKEAMDFLQISSPYLCTRLLRSTSFTFSGEKKGRIYYLIKD